MLRLNRLSALRDIGRSYFFTAPYKEGVSHLKAAFEILHQQKPLQINAGRLKALSIHLLAGTALCLPVLNIIILIAIKRFSPACQNEKPYSSDKKPTRVQQTAVKGVSPGPLELLNLPEKLLRHICSYTELPDLGRLAKTCRLLSEMASDTVLWQYWLKRLAIPTAPDEDARAKLTILLKYFKIAPGTHTLSLLKPPKLSSEADEYICSALKIYPFPATLLIPSEKLRFHFFYKSLDHEVHVWKDIGIGSGFSARAKVCNQLLSDNRYTRLTFSRTNS